MVPLSRRSFLVAAGGAVLLAACGADGTGTSTKDEPGGDELTAGRLSVDLPAGPDPQRFAFALFSPAGPAAGPAVEIRFVDPDGKAGAFEGAALHREGLPARRGVYTVEQAFPTAGQWVAELEVEGTRTEFPVVIAASSAMPAIGDPAPRAGSPTTDDPLGVDPICTRQPPCPLHDLSLESVIGAGKPVAVLFATPARCQSQYCGPVLDTMLEVIDPYRDHIEFVHVEIYQDLTSQDLVPTVDEWSLAGEPVLYGIDGAGMISGRIDGAFDQGEITSLLGQLA